MEATWASGFSPGQGNLLAMQIQNTRGWMEEYKTVSKVGLRSPYLIRGMTSVIYSLLPCPPSLQVPHWVLDSREDPDIPFPAHSPHLAPA
jgi:hypothetical protein